MNARTSGPLSDQQHEPWMADEHEDRADLMRAPDSIAEMEGHMANEVEARTGPLDSYSAADLALVVELAAAVKSRTALYGEWPSLGRADGEMDRDAVEDGHQRVRSSVARAATAVGTPSPPSRCRLRTCGPADRARAGVSATGATDGVAEGGPCIGSLCM